MKLYLEQKGFQVYMFNFSLFKGGLEEGALALQDFIAKYNLKRCILVGISTGAVTAYLYAQRYNGWDRVVKLICLGGPFNGTPWAYTFCFLKSGKQLLPNSKFLKKVQHEKNQHPSRIICIAAKSDELVPRWSSKLPNVEFKEISIVGHNNMHTLSEGVMKIIAQSFNVKRNIYI